MKKYFIHLIPVLSMIAFYFLVKEDEGTFVMKKATQKTAPAVPLVAAQPLPPTIDRSIASIPSPMQFPEKRKSVTHLYRQEVEAGPVLEGIPKHFLYAKNMRSVKTQDYSDGLGKKIYEANGMVFFKHDGVPSSSWSHVAYDSKRDKFYPISSVIKLEKVSKSEREELIGRGHEEYYYHPSLKILYLQNENGKLLSVYQELKNEGLKVSLEVLTDPNKPQ